MNFKALAIAALVAFAPIAAQADLTAAQLEKVKTYTVKLTEWAANPTIVKAVKDANAKAPSGMSNAKWEELPDGDATVKATMNNDAAKLFKGWESDKGINKLFLRDKNGAVIAGTGRTLLYNASKRKHIATALKDGVPSNMNEAKPDPSTGVKSIQLAVPVLDGGKAIGVLHTAINAD